MIKQDLEQGMPVVGEVIAELQEFIAQNANAFKNFPHDFLSYYAP